MPDVGGLNSTCLNTLLTLQHEASLGKETRLFEPFYTESDQDRLGTNMGKTKKGGVSAGIPAVVHAVYESPKWAPKAQGQDSLEFSLAAFLVAAVEYQYFVYGPANSWRLRNGAEKSFCPIYS